MTMRGRDVLVILDDVRSMAEKRGFPPVILDPNMSIRDGFTSNEGQKVYFYKVGIQELLANPSGDFELGEAMVPIVGIFHEVCGHGGQILNEFQKDTPLSRVLAANHYACKGSPYYYDGFMKGSDRYKRQPTEIAAQYAGIREARSYLIYANPKGLERDEDIVKFADVAIVAYQKTRMKRRSAFTGKDPLEKCGGFEDILLDLNKRFYDCVLARREYDALSRLKDPECPADIRHGIYQDAIFKYAARQGTDASTSGIVSRVSACRTGMQQDNMLAFAYLQIEKDDYANHDAAYRKAVGEPVGSLPVFNNDWLTYDAAFGRTAEPPEGVCDQPGADRRDMRLRQLDPVLMNIEANRPHAEGEKDGGRDGQGTQLGDN